MSHRPRRRFGQNFLHERGFIDRILAAVAPRPGDHILEIGPGQGALTAPLLDSGARLSVIEVDWDLAGELEARFADREGFRLVRDDALKVALTNIDAERPVRVVGNLPYNITTPLLFHLLRQIGSVADMHFMLQREVVERLAAAPGTKTYGRLSVMVQQACSISHLFDVPPGAFRPPPRVTSAVVRLDPRPEPLPRVRDQALFTQIVQAAFGQRRKTLRRALAAHVDESVFEAAGIDPASRAETLSPEAFGRLADAAAPAGR